MPRIFLILFMLMVMPQWGIASEFSYDAISKKFPLDAEYFAFEASQEIAKQYIPESTNLIIIPAKNDKLIDKMGTFLGRSGFKLDDKTADGVVMSYAFDYIDKKRAYLRLEFSDGNHIGVVRTLGEASPFIAPTATTNNQSNIISTPIQESNTIKETPAKENKMAQIQAQAPAKTAKEVMEENKSVETALTEIKAVQSAPIMSQNVPKVWELRHGSLMNQLDEWARQESWVMVWKSDYDLDLNAEARFTGDFLDVIEDVFNSLHKTNNGLRVNIYKQNKVIEVIGE